MVNRTRSPAGTRSGKEIDHEDVCVLFLNGSLNYFNIHIRLPRLFGNLGKPLSTVKNAMDLFLIRHGESTNNALIDNHITL